MLSVFPRNIVHYRGVVEPPSEISEAAVKMWLFLRCVPPIHHAV